MGGEGTGGDSKQAKRKEETNTNRNARNSGLHNMLDGLSDPILLTATEGKKEADEMKGARTKRWKAREGQANKTNGGKGKESYRKDERRQEEDVAV